MEEPKVIKIPEKKLVGMSIKTYLAENKTPVLWRQFMPRRQEIQNIVGNELYSMRIYDNFNPMTFTPQTVYEEWAAMEVTDFDSVPQDMVQYTAAGGEYAVFPYKGLAKDFRQTAMYIFGTWLPNSEYELDNREHFAVMGEKYLGPDNPNSEEDIWVPVRT